MLLPYTLYKQQSFGSDIQNFHSLIFEWEKNIISQNRCSSNVNADYYINRKKLNILNSHALAKIYESINLAILSLHIAILVVVKK